MLAGRVHVPTGKFRMAEVPGPREVLIEVKTAGVVLAMLSEAVIDRH
jgi:hypothetical protein